MVWTKNAFKTERILTRILSSNFVLLLLIVVVSDLALTLVLPHYAQDWYLNAIANNDELFCTKTINYVLDDHQPHLLLLGSSVLAAPSYACDQAEYSHKLWTTLPHMGLYSRYDNCKALSDRLAKATGEQIDVVNLGLAGTVASDYAAIMEKLSFYHNTPKLIVCCISPQEFFWNDSRSSDNTHISKAFRSYPWPAQNDIVQAYDRVRRAIAWHFSTVQAELGAEKQQLTWDFSNTLKNLNKTSNTNDPAKLATTSASNKPAIASTNPTPSDEPSTLAPSIAISTPGAGGGAAFANRKHKPRVHDQFEDLALYKKQYGTINATLFRKHVANFERTLEIAQKDGLNVAVINMPLTEQNKEVIPATAKQEYFDAVKFACARNSVPFYDLDKSDNFIAKDFYDSAHLNEHGAAKLFDRLSSMVSLHNGTYLTKAGATQ